MAWDAEQPQVLDGVVAVAVQRDSVIQLQGRTAGAELLGRQVLGELVAAALAYAAVVLDEGDFDSMGKGGRESESRRQLRGEDRSSVGIGVGGPAWWSTG